MDSKYGLGQRLHCDACGHDHPLDPQIGLQESHIGFPCPACGASMLTQDDYLVGKIVLASLDLLVEQGVLRRVDPTKTLAEQRLSNKAVASVMVKDGKIQSGPLDAILP